MQQDLAINRSQLCLERIQLPSLGFAGQKLFKQQCVLGNLLSALTQAHHQQLISQGQQT